MIRVLVEAERNIKNVVLINGVKGETMKLSKYIFAFLGAFYLLSGIGALLFSSFTIACVASLALGITMSAYVFYYDKINELCKNKVIKILKYLCLAGCIFVVAFSAFLETYGRSNNTTGKEDAVIVLGAAVKGTEVGRTLKLRLDTAFNYLNKNPNSVVVVAGGKGYGEDITEAEAMKNYLVSLGISENRILKEEESTSTFENFKFSKQILDKKFGKNYKVAFVTNNFHVLRAKSIAKDAGLDCSHIGADMHWFDLAPNCARETLAVLKYLIIGK